MASFLGLACVLAAHASAAPAPTLFRLTIVGTAHQQWSVTAAPIQEGSCSRSETTEGVRTATFRTKDPALVRLRGGRVLPVDVRGITGTVTLDGANSSEEICGATGTGKTLDCARTTRSFARAHVRLTSPRPGVVQAARFANVRLARSDCPLEPGEVTRRPLGPAMGLLRLPKAALMEHRLARITLTGSRSLKTAYASPEQGHLDERVEWTLTFVRAQSGTR